MFFLSIITLLFIGCDDMEPSTDHLDCLNPIYPNMTTSGVNKLACKVNGQPWVSCTPIFSDFDQLGIAFDPINNYFGLDSWWITKDRTIDEKIGFSTFLSDSMLGNFKIKDIINTSNYLIVNKGFRRYYIDTSQHNNLSIRYFDQDKKIIAGTFEFIAISSEGGYSDTVKITEGIFDGKYN